MDPLGNKTTDINTQDSNSFIAARVIDIILNINHPRAEEFGGYDGIGTIFWSYVNEPNQADDSKLLNSAKPFFSFIKQYPLKNEIVLLIDAPNKNYTFANNVQTRNATLKYYLPNVNIWNHQHNNALPDMVYHLEGNEETNYEKVGGTLIRTAEEDNSVEVPLGEYFKENLSIQPLLPFEGDTIVEGRFGNSIRLGATAKEAPDKTAYSTKGETGDPITIIRNGALVEEKDNGWEHTIENINSDHSTIYLTSNQVLPNMEIVSLHWQSWMAKHDELQVDQKDTFDNITEGFELESIEPEKPEEGADQELEEATEEDIAAEEELNEDPECNDEEVGEIYPEGNTIPAPEEGEAGTETDVSSIPPPPIEPQVSPTTQVTLPPDIPYKVEDWVQYYDPLPSNQGGMGMEILFYIMRGYSRTDGEEKKNFFLRDDGPYPAGSMRSYVFENDPGGLGDWGAVSIKDELEELIKAYRAGDRY
jgi:hypothetical protein|tara:strand:+ start:720 stop:2147 length:1428 start_codon:yes stop_codon:yes gene_type:complete